MPNLNLDANNSNQVGSAQKVSILTAEPNTWLFIYSGIAWQNQYADGSGAWFWESTTETDAIVNVKLDNLSGVLLEFATTGSLSGIYEESTWGDWYVNSTSLALQENGDLVLTASTTVIGEGTGFNTFSYYVSAKIILEAASISGTIRWKKTLATPLAPPHFVITANVHVPDPPPFGSTQVVASGVEGNLNSADDTYYYVPYTITGGLLGKTVMVIVAPVATSFTGAPGGGSLMTEQISGPNPISLTTSNLNATNVNFEMEFEPFPK